MSDFSQCVAFALSLNLNVDDTKFDDEALEYRRNVIWVLYVFKFMNILVNGTFATLKVNELRFDNIDVGLPTNPHLLKLVRAVRTLDLFIANRPTSKDRIILETDEMALCAQDRPRKVYDITENIQIDDLEQQADKYQYALSYSLTRCITNLFLITHELSLGKTHFANMAAKNILFYLAPINSSWAVQLPIVNKSLTTSLESFMRSPSKFYNYENYIRLLKPYQRKWRVIDESHERYIRFLQEQGINRSDDSA